MAQSFTTPVATLLSEVEVACVSYASACKAIQQWMAVKDELAEQLRSYAEAGNLPKATLLHDGSIVRACAGKTSVEYPEDVKAQIKQIQAKAVEDGLCTSKVGKPYFTFKAE